MLTLTDSHDVYSPLTFVSFCVHTPVCVGFGNESTKEFREFEFDTYANTSFDIANGLWDMIAEGVVE